MNAPKLRFGEFDGSWQELHLADVAIIQAGFAYKSIEMSRTPKDYQLIKMSNVYKNELRLDRNPSYWDKVSKSDAKFLMKSGDIVLTLTGTVGKTDFGYTAQIPCDGKFLLNQRLVYLRSIVGVSDPKFLLSKLRTSRFYYKFFAEAKGGTGNQANVGMSELAKIKLSYPFYPEQQKIASFLSKVDEKIALLTEKKDKLTEYKKGVMQQLFNGKWEEQDGQLTFIPPTLRFKADDGSKFPDWEEIELGKLSKKSTVKNKDNSVSAVLTNSATQGIISQADYFDRDIANQSNLDGYYVVNPDDFVYNPRISIPAPVGPINRNKIDVGVMSPLYTVFSVKKGLNLSYLEYFFKTTNWHRYMNSIANFGARHDRMNITTSDFFKMPIPVPCIAEQNKIVYFVSSIDQKIDLANSELEKAKEWKKGLLQQMFV